MDKPLHSTGIPNGTSINNTPSGSVYANGDTSVLTKITNAANSTTLVITNGLTASN